MVEHSLIDSNATLGLIEFGSEAFYSTQNVTFTVENYGVNLNKNLAAAPSPVVQSSATSTPPSQNLEMQPDVSNETSTLTSITPESMKKTNAAGSFGVAFERSWWIGAWMIYLAFG